MAAGVSEARADGHQASTPPVAADPAAPGETGALFPAGREILDTILEAVTVGVVVQHRDGTPLLANRVARTLLEELPDGVLTPVAAAGGYPLIGTAAPATRSIPLPADDPEPTAPPRQLLATTVPLAFGSDRVAALVTTL